MATETETTSSATSASLGNATLSTLINTATRTQHTELNRLIISRLALAIPPQTSSALAFSRGIVPFARIYQLFEIEWDLFTRHVEQKPQKHQRSGREREIDVWLAGLRPAGLARSSRIQNDLRHLHARVGSKTYSTVTLGDQWETKVRALVRQKPHLFVAFAWVFYMAIFSGGRWIRQQLADAPPQFWLSDDATRQQLEKEKEKPATDLPGFSLFSFDGDADGEDIKALFRSRLLEAETLLSSSEKDEIVEMSQLLFDRCVKLVGELDQLFWREQVWASVRYVMLFLFAIAVLALAVGSYRYYR